MCTLCSIYSSQNIKWKAKLTSIQVEPFVHPTGPRVTIPSIIMDIFFLFFTSSVMEHIVDQSNKYAAECMGDKFQTWQQITVQELSAYLGFMILMGLVKLPRLADYWKKDTTYHYSPVASRITRDRFIDLNRYLHFADNSTLSAPQTPGYNKLGKIEPIIAMLRDRFADVWNPGKNVSIDEAMIPFKGRSGLKQYMPNKPIKRGIKVWMRADADNGYVSAFEVYTGKKGNTAEKGLGAKVVKGLSEQLYGSYRHVYFDNYFSSVDLALDLFRSKLYSCGTLRTNRKGFPVALKAVAKKGLKKRGKSKSRQQGNLTVSVWQDNRPVVMIATNSDPTTTSSVLRKNKDGTTNTYSCPKSLMSYNQHMGGVDQNDQLRGYYHVRLKCRKHYKYVFWFLFDLAITNAFILYQTQPGNRRKTLRDFRTDLAKELINNYSSRKRAGRPSIAPPTTRFCSSHFPMKVADTPRHRCYYCYLEMKRRHDTDWYCNDCKLHLCHTGLRATDCFRKYHTRFVDGIPCANIC